MRAGAASQHPTVADAFFLSVGSLPSDLDDYRKLSQKQVLKQLQNVNRDLKKYSHVNKKALDQYMHFSEQRDKFVERKKELDEGAQARHIMRVGDGFGG